MEVLIEILVENLLPNLIEKIPELISNLTGLFQFVDLLKMLVVQGYIMIGLQLISIIFERWNKK